jgi:hypothetical protein
MGHRLELPGGRGPEIVVVSGNLAMPEVFVDGQPVARVREAGHTYWPIPTRGGGTKRLYIRNSLTGLRAAVDGTVIPLERQLSYWEVIVALLPFGLIGLGMAGSGAGIVGGAVGIVASGVNLRLMRRPWPVLGRVLAVLAVFGVATVLTLLVVGAMRGI